MVPLFRIATWLAQARLIQIEELPALGRGSFRSECPGAGRAIEATLSTLPSVNH